MTEGVHLWSPAISSWVTCVGRCDMLKGDHLGQMRLVSGRFDRMDDEYNRMT